MNKLGREENIKRIIAMVFTMLVLYSLYPMVDFYFEAWPIKLAITFVGIMVTYCLSSFCLYKVSLKDAMGNSDSNATKGRNSGLDLLRVFAALMVITVHLIITVGYYDKTIMGTGFWFATILRWLAQTCCPIFMLLSGYFLINHEMNKKHYMSLVHLLRNYTVISIIAVIYYQWTSMDKIKALVSLGEFWYIDMYFGMLLLSPFINILLKQCDKMMNLSLILILFTLSSLGTICDNWFSDYWYGLYPLLYYVIGANIRKYGIRMNKKISLFILLVFVLCLESTYTYFSGYGQVFNWTLNYGGYSCAYNSVPVLICSVVLFLLFDSINIKNRAVAYIVGKISGQSLEIYLLVSMFVGGWIFNPIYGALFPKYGLVISLTAIGLAELILGTLIGIVLNLALDFLQGKILQNKMQ